MNTCRHQHKFTENKLILGRLTTLYMHSPTTTRMIWRSVILIEFSTLQVQLPVWSRVTPVIVSNRVSEPKIPELSETVVPLLSVHEMVGVGLPIALLPHTSVMSSPSSITRWVSPGPSISGGTEAKHNLSLLTQYITGEVHLDLAKPHNIPLSQRFHCYSKSSWNGIQVTPSNYICVRVYIYVRACNFFHVYNKCNELWKKPSTL